MCSTEVKLTGFSFFFFFFFFLILRKAFTTGIHNDL